MTRRTRVHVELIWPLRARLPVLAHSPVDAPPCAPEHRREVSLACPVSPTSASPLAAFRYVPGWQSWTDGEAANTAAGCTPGRRDAWSSSGGKFHRGPKRGRPTAWAGLWGAEDMGGGV